MEKDCTYTVVILEITERILQTVPYYVVHNRCTTPIIRKLNRNSCMCIMVYISLLSKRLKLKILDHNETYDTRNGKIDNHDYVLKWLVHMLKLHRTPVK